MTVYINYNEDYYRILNLEKTSTPEQIKKQYKKLAGKYHPDKGGSENEFKRINEAYTILMDKNTRSLYDSKYTFTNYKTFTLPISFKECLTGVSVSTHIGLIAVPAGAQNGTKIKYLDNIIEIKVEASDRFRREKDDLYTVLEVSSLVAIVGDVIPFLNADEELINVNIPTLMKYNTIIKVMEKGVPNISSGKRGNLYIKCIIETPDLTPEQVSDIMASINHTSRSTYG
jgi:DnaJ-class molecular chaperone